MTSRLGAAHQQGYLTAQYPDDPKLSNTPKSIIAYSILFILACYYVFQNFDYYPLLSIHELAWDLLVYTTPSRLVHALDRRIKGGEASKARNFGSYSGSQNFAAKSEAMWHILGLEGTGILTKFQRSRSLSGIRTVFKSQPSEGLPGLGNWDNSCYQNSVIQGLASLSSLSTFLDQTTLDTTLFDGPSTKVALKSLIWKLNDPTNAGQRIWTPVELKSMSSWQQQDAQEYYSKILDEVDKENARTVKRTPRDRGLSDLEILNQEPIDVVVDSSHKSVMHKEQPICIERTKCNFDKLPEELASTFLRNPLEGLLAQRVGCLQCGYVEGLSLIPFNCLTVPLGRQWEYDIRTCLDDYTALESISGVECSKCTLLRQKQQLERLLQQAQELSALSKGSSGPRLSEALYQSANSRLNAVNDALEDEDFSENTLLKKCQIPVKSRVSTTKTRQAVIARLPTSLVVHVNRSVFDEFSGMQSKNYTNVRFPKQLDLSAWSLGSFSTSSGEDCMSEVWEVNPSLSMLPDIQPDQAELPVGNNGTIFVLRAVITHYGRHENGHYICYRKSPEQVNVTQDYLGHCRWWRLSDDDVSEVSEENVLAQGGVFMLFYERVSELDLSSNPKMSDQPATQTAAVDKTAVNIVEADKPIHKPLQNRQQSEPEPKEPSLIRINLWPETLPPTDTITTKENRQTTPPMRTAGVSRRDSTLSMAGKAMSSVSSMVRAN